MLRPEVAKGPVDVVKKGAEAGLTFTRFRAPRKSIGCADSGGGSWPSAHTADTLTVNTQSRDRRDGDD